MRAAYAFGTSHFPKESPVNSPHIRLSPLEVRERAVCMCRHGERCSSFAPGHALHLIQARLASATPRGWVDALVREADESGVVTIATLDGDVYELWNGGSAAFEATKGAPVAFHRDYGVLAIGRARYNVALV